VFKQGAVKTLFTQIFQDADGLFSSKRVIAFLAFIVMVIAFALDVGLHITATDYIFNGFLALTLGALGITGIEGFAKRPAGVTQNTKVEAKQADVNVGGTPPAEE
jgi:hypothetical protein